MKSLQEYLLEKLGSLQERVDDCAFKNQCYFMDYPNPEKLSEVVEFVIKEVKNLEGDLVGVRMLGGMAMYQMMDGSGDKMVNSIGIHGYYAFGDITLPSDMVQSTNGNLTIDAPRECVKFMVKTLDEMSKTYRESLLQATALESVRVSQRSVHISEAGLGAACLGIILAIISIVL